MMLWPSKTGLFIFMYCMKSYFIQSYKILVAKNNICHSYKFSKLIASRIKNQQSKTSFRNISI